MRFIGWCAVLALMAMLPRPAASQSFPCNRARTPVEKAICADPSLGALDQTLANAFRDALQREPTNAAALKDSQALWLRQRDATCAVPAARIVACLNGQLNARVAALSPPVASVAATSVAIPPPAPPPAEPRAPALTLPDAAATLERSAFPAAPEQATLLRVTTPGRFAITARSATGTALQLVDMLVGPSDPVGEAGVRDGRMDQLLDVGTYKLRATVAKDAAGPLALQVQPFRAAARPTVAPPPGEVMSSTLADLEQRSVWLMVPPGGAVRIDAAGRSLADLRLWRQGTDLVDLQPEAAVIEPTRGHRLNRLRLSGTVAPGAYLLTAYGGPALAWSDASAEQPLHVRVGALDALQAGGAAGTLGPLGSALYTAPPRATAFRLSLPQAAPVTLDVDDSSASLQQNSRDPRLMVQTATRRSLVEVTGPAGQAFRLRAMDHTTAQVLGTPGRWWVSASALGMGGDEVPPTVLLTRTQGNQPAAVVAGNAPRIDPASPLRLRFNVRGPTTVLLQSTGQGPLTVRDTGQDTTALRARPYDMALVRDYLEYSILPAPGKQGVADVTFGPGTPAPPGVQPADPVIPLGVQTLAAGQRLQLYGNAAPGASIGLVTRAAPVRLSEGPLAISQAAGAALDVPLAAGEFTVTDLAGGAVPVSSRALQDGSTLLTLPAPAAARTVAISLRRTALPRPDVVLASQGAALPVADAGTPRPFDLARDAKREFELHVSEGGLYRIETLGRLRTTGAIGTAFLPALDTAEANGVGQNMLMQRWLRAGRYRVMVGTQAGTTGHGALLVSPAPLLDSPALRPAGSVRARLPAGTGLRIPVEIAEAGDYHLELRALDRTLTARFDDAEGWPLTTPGEVQDLDQTLQPGRYQLLVSPEAVETRLVARLVRVRPDNEIVGHGPHALVFDAPRTATWREPPGRDDARVPDRWTFTLAGPATVRLAASDGMAAVLLPEAGGAPLGRFTRGADFKGRLDAGRYAVEAMSLGRNDRLDYQITLSAPELQPGVMRMVKPDAQVPFTLADARIVSLTTFGTVPMKAVLRDAAGVELARYGDRGTDWNLAVARPLPAGSYRLDLSPAVPPAGTDIAGPASPSADDADKETDPAEPASQSSPAAPEAADTSDATEAKEEDVRTVEVLLTLPEVRDDPAPGTLPGGFVHRIPVPAAAADQLLLATARSAAEVVLALERQDASGAWSTVGLAQGTAPVVAAPGAAGVWRVVTWAVDGGQEPITIAARPVAADAQSPGRVQLAPEGDVGVARVALGSPGLVSLDGAGLLAGGWAGHALTVPEGGAVAPQSDTLWIVGPAPGPVTVMQVSATGPVAVPVPAGGRAQLAAVPMPSCSVRAWLARAGTDQPGLDAGQGMGVAPGSALAVGTGPVQVWNAGAAGPLRPSVLPIDLAMQEARKLDAGFTGILPPRSATPLTLPAGERRTVLSLAPGLAAVAGRAGDAVTAWSGEAPLTRTLPGSWTELLLLNTTDQPAPAAVAWTAAPVEALQADAVLKSFFGSAGSFQVPFTAPAGAQLRLAGPGTMTVIAAGQVRRGRTVPAGGAGQVIVEHAPGALALWIEADGRNPWPQTTAQPAALPSRLALSGAAMALSIAPGGPVLLHARSSAPVILTLGSDAPTLFPAGADLNRYVAADTVLRIDSPHDGPLTGTLSLSAEPVIPIAEGLGAAVAVPPGGTAAFGFQIARATDVGIGIRAEPDRAETRLLRADGAVMGEGAALLQRLPAGRYVIEARNPSDSVTALLRPAVVGITPRGAGPPPEVARRYLQLVGLGPKDEAP